MHRKAEEESHSGVLWATTRTQRGAAWAAYVERLRMLGTKHADVPELRSRTRRKKTGSPADAGLPGFHGWAYWGAGSHPRQSDFI